MLRLTEKILELETRIQTLVEDSKNVRAVDTALNATSSVSPVRGLHGLKTEARTRPVPEIVWPNPTRPERHG